MSVAGNKVGNKVRYRREFCLQLCHKNSKSDADPRKLDR